MLEQQQDKQKIELALNNGRLNIRSQQYIKNLRILQNKSAKQSTQILLGWNENPKIIDHLSFNNSYKKLLLLTLNGNNIESIQTLTRIQMPELIHLQLMNNNIVSIHSLRKGNFPKLKQINFCQSKIKDLHKIKFEQSYYPNMKQLILYSNFDFIDRALVKCNFNLNFVIAHRQHEIPNVLKRKFINFSGYQQNDI